MTGPTDDRGGKEWSTSWGDDEVRGIFQCLKNGGELAGLIAAVTSWTNLTTSLREALPLPDDIEERQRLFESFLARIRQDFGPDLYEKWRQSPLYDGTREDFGLPPESVRHDV